LDGIKLKYVTQIASQFSKGPVWSKKLKKTYKLFDLDFNDSTQRMKSVVSIWYERNKLAHSSRLHYLPIKIVNENNQNIIFNNDTSKEEYLNFCL